LRYQPSEKKEKPAGDLTQSRTCRKGKKREKGEGLAPFPFSLPQARKSKEGGEKEAAGSAELHAS